MKYSELGVYWINVKIKHPKTNLLRISIELKSNKYIQNEKINF